MSRSLVIGISGGVGVGKSTIVKDLCNHLKEKGLEVSVLEIDSYYKDLR
jgi:uridine kinase